jgi:uncharacterized protein (UPF0297 family)
MVGYVTCLPWDFQQKEVIFMSDDGKILFFVNQKKVEEVSSFCGGQAELPAPDAEMTLASLIHILREQESDPVSRLAGFLVSDDPTYLPEDADIRSLVHRVGRDKLLETLIESYVRDHPVSSQSEL